MEKGTLYGVGVGPGDPELITIKAVRLIKEAHTVAIPGEDPYKAASYRIAVQAVPELAEKELMALPMPMIKDRDALARQHEKNAGDIMERLDVGEDVVFLTLGDPNIYSTFSYIRAIVSKAGYDIQTISGVTSFCAAASRLGVPLADWDEAVHIIPVGQIEDCDISQPGTYIFMKPRGAKLKKRLKEAKCDTMAVANCGMPGERIYRSIDEIPDDVGYFTIFISRGEKDDR